MGSAKEQGCHGSLCGDGRYFGVTRSGDAARIAQEGALLHCTKLIGSDVLPRLRPPQCSNGLSLSGNGWPFVSGANGKTISPSRKIKHIVTPAYRIGSGYPA